MAFKKVDFERAVGMGALALKVGPARRDSKIYDGLVRLGVLQKPLSSWPVEGVLNKLPWGSGSVEYPEPKLRKALMGHGRRIRFFIQISRRPPGSLRPASSTEFLQSYGGFLRPQWGMADVKSFLTLSLVRAGHYEIEVTH